MPIPAWCWILGAIILLIFLVLFSKIKLILVYDDSFSVCIKLWFLKFKLYPSENKEHKKKEKPKKADSKAQKKPKEKAKMSPDKIIKLIKAMKDIVADLISSFFGKLHINFVKIHADIGCEDACKTALAYGAVTQSVAYVIEFLDNITNVDKSRSSDIDIRANFISQKSWVELNCLLYLRVISLFPLGIKGLKAFFKYKYIQEKLLEVEKDGTIEAK